MKQTSRISIAIAAWNGEKYIADQLRSLFQQTRPPDEIIITDDSRNDRTELVVRQVMKEWNGRLQYSRNPAVLGIEGNFRNAVRRTTGDIVFLCDQDDVWLPEKVEVLAGELETHPEALLVACNSEMVDSNLNPIHATIPADLKNAEPLFQAINSGNAFPCMISLKLIIPGHAMAMKRAMVPLFLRMPETLRYHDVWAGQTAALFESLRYVNRTLTLYRVHANNASAPANRTNIPFGISRLQEVMQTNQDIEQTIDLFKALMSCSNDFPLSLPQKNRDFLESNLHYFQERQKLRAIKRPFRFFALTKPLIQDYFRIGTGWRAFLRDQLL